jgi:hypothetical protein
MRTFCRLLPVPRKRLSALAVVAAACLVLPAAVVAPVHAAPAADAPVSCGANSSSSHGAACTITPVDATDTRIDQPFVAGPSYEYSSIVFQPGDQITLNAGGCVQTGGAGATWKRYVNPSGSSSGTPDGLYWAWVTIPGAFFTDNPAQPVTHVPFDQFALGTKHSFFIPKLDAPSDATQHLDLILGYTDDQYDDNGYYDHDDGNDDQCALDHDGGSAWVTVGVQHGVAGPMPAVHPKPFDLVPTAYDSNLLFKNPAWGWQVNHGTVATDGDYVNCVFHSPTPCQSQATTFDHIGWDLWGALGGIVGKGLCGEDAITGANAAGHLNWFDATYTGQIHWDEWSGNVFGDDDYNMLLTTPNYQGTGPAGTTASNTDAIKLEFDSDETIDNFDQQPWWSRLHYYVDLNDRATIDHFVEGHDAVVTGLVGLDTEHGAASEVHPVHVLAIREQAPGSVDPANDSWAIFARNWGNEGECGSQQHYLDASTITIDLPRPGGISPTAVAKPIGDNTFYAHGTNTGPAIHPSTGGVQVSFTLPNGADKPFEVGEVHLNWTGAVAAARPAPAQPAVAAHTVRPADEGDDGDAEAVLADIWAAMTPAQQQTAGAFFDQMRPHTRLDSSAVATTVSTTAPPMPTSVPTVSSAPNLVANQRIHAQFEALCAATDGNLPTQPGWCQELNQPPVTTLTTTGGTPGPNGWLTTPVTATLTAHDASGSGISRTEYSYDNQNWTTYTGPFTLPDGTYSFSYRSQDNKSNLEGTRQQSFKIDTKPPTVTITQPTAGPYTHSSTLTLAFGADDGPTSGLGAGSGVASVTSTMDGASTVGGHGLGNGQAINLLRELPLGSHTFTVAATDNVGHATSKAVTFTIIVTPDSIEDDVRQFYRSGDIANASIEHTLLTDLDVAKAAWPTSICLAASAYRIFITDVQLLKGTFVSATAARILTDDANYLIAQCGQPHRVAT